MTRSPNQLPSTRSILPHSKASIGKLRKQHALRSVSATTSTWGDNQLNSYETAVEKALNAGVDLLWWPLTSTTARYQPRTIEQLLKLYSRAGSRGSGSNLPPQDHGDETAGQPPGILHNETQSMHFSCSTRSCAASLFVRSDTKKIRPYFPAEMLLLCTCCYRGLYSLLRPLLGTADCSKLSGTTHPAA